MTEVVAINQPQLMELAKEKLTGKWGMAVGVTAIYFIGAALLQVIPFASLILSGPLAYGLAYYFLKVSRSQPTDVEDIFEGFKNFVKAMLAGIFIMILVIVGMICLIVPGIMLALGLSMTYYIMIDNPQLSVSDAMKKSWDMMDGHKMDYFILGLRFIGWALLCILTLFIGFLFLIPYMQTTFANFYNRISNSHDSLKGDIIDHLVV